MATEMSICRLTYSGMPGNLLSGVDGNHEHAYKDPVNLCFKGFVRMPPENRSQDAVLIQQKALVEHMCLHATSISTS